MIAEEVSAGVCVVVLWCGFVVVSVSLSLSASRRLVVGQHRIIIHVRFAAAPLTSLRRQIE